jgi:hypothetical protein
VAVGLGVAPRRGIDEQKELAGQFRAVVAEYERGAVILLAGAPRRIPPGWR